ncbi:MAG: UDP-N-acetylmuramoyl-L-alanine--D-glutamate ligase [Pseudomonadales bacterium]
MAGQPQVVIGLGESGRSVARHLAAENIPFMVGEDHPSPAALHEMSQLHNPPSVAPISEIPMHPGAQWIVSPGVPLSLPQLRQAPKYGVTLTNDVALFAERAKAPLVGITGSNGKTTVTSLVGHLAKSQMSSVRVGGNIGTPCLDLLDEAADCYVLELSSYHLELAQTLPLEVGALLNLSPDHLDRYASAEDYYAVKSNIFNRAQRGVVGEACRSYVQTGTCSSVSVFGESACSGFGLLEQDGQIYLAQGLEPLLDVRKLGVEGLSNWLNALAALAIGNCLGLDMDRMTADLRSFEGLPHRCQRIDRNDGCCWINDSKATNVGATVAAIRSYKASGALILLLGGQGKSADFSMLNSVLLEQKALKAVLVYGEAAEEIRQALDAQLNVRCFLPFEEMVAHAMALANAGDVILLSPACSSFDQFSGYEARGDRFMAMLEGGSS